MSRSDCCPRLLSYEMLPTHEVKYCSCKVYGLSWEVAPSNPADYLMRGGCRVCKITRLEVIPILPMEFRNFAASLTAIQMERKRCVLRYFTLRSRYYIPLGCAHCNRLYVCVSGFEESPRGRCEVALDTVAKVAWKPDMLVYLPISVQSAQYIV